MCQWLKRRKAKYRPLGGAFGRTDRVVAHRRAVGEVPALLRAQAALRHFGAKKGPDYTVRWVRHGNVSLLHHAALNDFAELTDWLIQHGADTEIFSSPSSSTPAYTPLMMACKFNCTRSACVLVNAGANVNVRVHDGLKGGGDLTPLHIAIQLGHMDLAAFNVWKVSSSKPWLTVTSGRSSSISSGNSPWSTT